MSKSWRWHHFHSRDLVTAWRPAFLFYCVWLHSPSLLCVLTVTDRPISISILFCLENHQGAYRPLDADRRCGEFSILRSATRLYGVQFDFLCFISKWFYWRCVDQPWQNGRGGSLLQFWQFSGSFSASFLQKMSWRWKILEWNGTNCRIVALLYPARLGMVWITECVLMSENTLWSFFSPPDNHTDPTVCI